MATLTEQIREAANGSGLSQAELREATGIDRGALSRFLAGRDALGRESLDRLAAALGLELRAVRKRKGR